MKAVFWKECRHQLLSFRSAFFVLLFVILGISLEQLFSLAAIEIGGIDNKTYAGSFYVVIKLAVILLGYLFASILSHGCINRETESKSARLIISKISRTEYIVGKYLANITFWVICFILIYGCLFLKYKVFDVSELITNTVRAVFYPFAGRPAIDRNPGRRFIFLLRAAPCHCAGPGNPADSKGI